MYWVSGIAFDPDNDKRPWLWMCSESEMCVSKAINVMENAREVFHLIDGWIEKQDENGNMNVIYHVSYIDCFGETNRRRII